MGNVIIDVILIIILCNIAWIPVWLIYILYLQIEENGHIK